MGSVHWRRGRGTAQPAGQALGLQHRGAVGRGHPFQGWADACPVLACGKQAQSKASLALRFLFLTDVPTFRRFEVQTFAAYPLSPQSLNNNS